MRCLGSASLLDAIELLDGPVASGEALEEFLSELRSVPRSRTASVALGDDVRFRGQRVVGSGLELEHELIQLCAFSSDGAIPVQARIRRPSRRR